MAKPLYERRAIQPAETSAQRSKRARLTASGTRYPLITWGKSGESDAKESAPVAIPGVVAKYLDQLMPIETSPLQG